jgi:hypothetical protein
MLGILTIVGTWTHVLGYSGVRRQHSVEMVVFLGSSTTIIGIVEVLAIENEGSGGFCPEERLPEPADGDLLQSDQLR